MRYIPGTDKSENIMLEKIGVAEFEDLLNIIPAKLRTNAAPGIGSALSEMELHQLSRSISGLNNSSESNISFMGGGSYDHFIPSAVDFLSSRSEYYTAYTPYQAEVSQGTLQAMYEFQTLICEISGFDVSNASLYDGGSAVAEACSMSLSISKKRKILISSLLTPQVIEVIQTYMQNRDVDIQFIPEVNGKTDINWVRENLDDTASVLVQSPNYFGLIEDWSQFSFACKSFETLLIAISNPFDLALVKSPGECGADIFAGEGQSLGNPTAFGGPYLGLIATRSKFVRKMPGRIIGRTVDQDGKEGFVLTLQTREQHIRRENATSNICTNQGLLALRATIYLSLMGKENFPKLAKICMAKAHYAADKISQIDGFTLPYGREFIKEFVVQSPVPASLLIQQALDKSIFISGVHGDESDKLLLIAVTEKRSKSEIDYFINFLKDVRNY